MVWARHYFKNMKHGGNTLLCIIGVWAFWQVANGAARDVGGSSYQGIAGRNVFGLKPPPPPPIPEANTPPLPRIFLQGIATIGGVKRALLKAQIAPKPGEKPAGDQSFILAEGQRDGDIEVLEISVVGQSSFVKVNDFGTLTTLTFEKDGIKGALGGSASSGMPAPITVPPVTQRPAEPALSAEANALMLEVNRLRHQQEIQAGLYPPLPHSPLSDAIQQEMPGAPVSTPVQQPTLPLPPGGARPFPP